MITDFYDGCPVCPGENPRALYTLCSTNVGQVSSKIKALVWMTCGTLIGDLTDLSDTGDWYQGLLNGSIVATPCSNTDGNWKTPTVNKKQYSACCPEKVKEILRGIEFTDWNWDCDDFSNIEFYTDKMVNQDYYQLGILTCDNLFYGFLPACHYSLAYYQNPETEVRGEMSNFLDIDIILPKNYVFKPVRLSGLCDVLTRFATGEVTPPTTAMEYDPNASYLSGDIVSLDGVCYQVLVDNPNTPPQQSQLSNQWSVVACP